MNRLAIYTNDITIIFCNNSLLQAGAVLQATPKRHRRGGVIQTVNLQCCQRACSFAARSVINRLWPFFLPQIALHAVAGSFHWWQERVFWTCALQHSSRNLLGSWQRPATGMFLHLFYTTDGRYNTSRPKLPV